MYMYFVCVDLWLLSTLSNPPPRTCVRALLEHYA